MDGCAQIIMQDVGSTTTLVVEMLKAADVPITDAEATLFAIGIHADTGEPAIHELESAMVNGHPQDPPPL